MEPIREGNFWDRLYDGVKVRVVELDPPKSSDISRYLDCARDLKRAGIDLLTIPDGPSAKARVDSCMMASNVKRNLGMEVLPHITCRDRNGIALRALFMGLQADGINDALLVTGDPLGVEEKPVEVLGYKSVFEYNSRDMAKKIGELVGEELTNPFNLFGALNVNAANFDAEMDKAKAKIESGMCGLLTQPIFSEEAIANLERASKELECFIFGGILPITSAAAARYMNDEVPGIKIPEEIISQFEDKKRADASMLSVQLSVETAAKIETLIDGFYIITPGYRTDLVCDILSKI